MNTRAAPVAAVGLIRLEAATRGRPTRYVTRWSRAMCRLVDAVAGLRRAFCAGNALAFRLEGQDAFDDRFDPQPGGVDTDGIFSRS